MPEIHPFAPFLSIIAKGPRLSRPLTREETRVATTMILNGEVEDMQLGAYLCVLRVRSEDPVEGAGFVDAVRAQLDLPENCPAIDLDWPTYAGKARQLPYFILAALALAQSGVKIFMHGVESHTDGRVFTPEVLRELGIPEASSLKDAAYRLTRDNFCYLPAGHIHPKLKEIMGLKGTLGVRTPVNTFVRMINTFSAPHIVQCITHNAYRDIHRECADLLEQPKLCVFKGEGGEIERRAAKPVTLQFLRNGVKEEESWPAFLDSDQAAHDDEMDIKRLAKIWAGEDTHPYALAAIVGTIAIVLRTMDKAQNVDEAHAQAEAIWHARTKDKIPYGNA